MLVLLIKKVLPHLPTIVLEFELQFLPSKLLPFAVIVLQFPQHIVVQFPGSEDILTVPL